MSAGNGLLQAILEEPDKDDLRLIYADYLDEQGQPERAEFIRESIRVPQMAFVTLTRRDPFPLLGLEPGEPQEVFSRDVNGPTIEYRTWMWGEMDDLGCVIGDLGRGLDYRVDRGFIEAVSCRCQDWLKHGPELVRQQPIRRVRLSDRAPACASMPGPHWLGDEGWNEHEVDACVIPPELYDLLTAGVQRAFSRSYDATESAYSDLSDACLTWAKQQEPALCG